MEISFRDPVEPATMKEKISLQSLPADRFVSVVVASDGNAFNARYKHRVIWRSHIHDDFGNFDNFLNTYYLTWHITFGTSRIFCSKIAIFSQF